MTYNSETWVPANMLNGAFMEAEVSKKLWVLARWIGEEMSRVLDNVQRSQTSKSSECAISNQCDRVDAEGPVRGNYSITHAMQQCS